MVNWDKVPFWTLSHSKKISSPPLTEPLFLLTRQIRSSAVLGAPDGAEASSQRVNATRLVGLHSGDNGPRLGRLMHLLMENMCVWPSFTRLSPYRA